MEIHDYPIRNTKKYWWLNHVPDQRNESLEGCNWNIATVKVLGVYNVWSKAQNTETSLWKFIKLGRHIQILAKHIYKIKYIKKNPRWFWFPARYKITCLVKFLILQSRIRDKQIDPNLCLVEKLAKSYIVSWC